jgi:hypothetical protein
MYSKKQKFPVIFPVSHEANNFNHLACQNTGIPFIGIPGLSLGQCQTFEASPSAGRGSKTCCPSATAP